ncbi:AI-2E family transporter [Actinomyces sp. 2119]|nr:AI-2E family transporter [Actinomyces sp. 2119]RJF43827.1 AI-2E family transporter [Actinomyces sp. 2119]
MTAVSSVSAGSSDTSGSSDTLVPSVSRVQDGASDTTRPTRSQGEVIVVTVAALVVAAVGLYMVRSLVAPAFFALTLVVTIRPLVSWAARHHVPRGIAAVGAIAILYAFVLSLFAALGVAVAQLVDTLPGYSSRFQQIWADIERMLTSMGVDQASLLDQATSALDTSRVVSLAQTLLEQLTSAGSMMMIMALVIVFLMFDTMRIEGRVRALTEFKPEIASAMTGFAASVRSYWLVSTTFGLIVAVLDVFALWALNVPMAVTWGVVSFITNYIPNIGFVVGVIPPALLALVDSGPWTALWVVVAYSVLNFVIQTLIQPKFTGDAVGLNTTTTFVSLMFWSTVIGGLGTILAVPLTLFAKALLIDSDPRSRWVGIFLTAGDQPLKEQEPEAPDALGGPGKGPERLRS